MTQRETFLEKCVKIDPLQIQSEFTEVAATLAYWNEQYADALRGQLHAKIARERLYAQLYFDKRKELADSGVSRVTESMTENAIEIDPRFIAVRDEEADALAESTRLRGVVEAVRTKKDMLVSLGAQLRAEMEGDPSIRSQHRNAHINTDDLDS